MSSCRPGFVYVCLDSLQALIYLPITAPSVCHTFVWWLFTAGRACSAGGDSAFDSLYAEHMWDRTWSSPAEKTWPPKVTLLFITSHQSPQLFFQSQRKSPSRIYKLKNACIFFNIWYLLWIIYRRHFGKWYSELWNANYLSMRSLFPQHGIPAGLSLTAAGLCGWVGGNVSTIGLDWFVSSLCP